MTLASVRVQESGGITVAHVEGEVDMGNAAQVGSQLFDAASNAAPGLVVDLSDVKYLDSRGVQLLLELAERLGVRDQRLHLVVPARALIRRVLLLIRIDAVVPLFPSVEAAVQKMKAPQE